MRPGDIPTPAALPERDALVTLGAFFAGLQAAAARVTAGYEQALAPLRESSGEPRIEAMPVAAQASFPPPAVPADPFIGAVLDIYAVRQPHRADVTRFLATEIETLTGLVVLSRLIGAETPERPRLEVVRFAEGDETLFVWLPFAGDTTERAALLERLDRAWFETGRAHAARLTIDTESG